MGIHDRDYYRDDAGGLFDAWARQGMTVWLIGISCVVWLAQMVSLDVAGARAGLTVLGWYDPQAILRGEVWRLVTPLFMHLPTSAGLIALAFNMLTLYTVGRRLEERYGGRELLLFYLAAGIFAYSAYFLTQLMVGPLPNQQYAIGPTPVVVALLVVFACLYPREQIIFIVIPMPAWLLVVCYLVFAVLNSVGPATPIPLTAYLAGALFGFVYYRTGFRLVSLLPSLPSRSRERAAPKLRVVRPDSTEAGDEPEAVAAGVESAPRSGVADEPFEARVDRILEKVSKHGQESLTAEERELLFRASELYKRRRK